MMSTEETKAPRPKGVGHDETPSGITDHPFEPKGEWWSLCGFCKADGNLCNLAESAHKETTLRYVYVGDTLEDE